jgi:heterodisulfide reductase subunit A-like polyferredoxin
MARVIEAVGQHGIDRIVLAGCPAIERAGLVSTIASAAGIPAPHAAFLLLIEGNDAATAAPAIRRAVTALEAMPGFEIRRRKLRQDVLVIGAGPAGLEAADSLATLGHAVTMI